MCLFEGLRVQLTIQDLKRDQFDQQILTVVQLISCKVIKYGKYSFKKKYFIFYIYFFI